jgi:hypothetical protein
MVGFLNVDLDIHSAAPLEPLVAAFGRAAYALYVGREGRSHSAHLELAGMPRNPDHAIRRFVALIDKLPRPARRIWNQARIREFNIGIEAGMARDTYLAHVDADTISAIARVNARIGITVYGAESNSPPLSSGPVKRIRQV